MLQSLKSHFFKVEKAMATCLPPEVLAYVLPLRFRIARHYAGTGSFVGKGSRHKALRYFDQICRRKKYIAEVFERDREIRETGRHEVPIVSALSDETLRTLLAQHPSRLSDAARNLNKFGMFRIAAVFRAVLLLRSALDHIATGQNNGKREDAIVLEILGNDWCQCIIDKPGIMHDADRDRLIQAVGEAAEWTLDRKISVFIDDKSTKDEKPNLILKDQTVTIQGPSSRVSDLADVTTDAIAIVGYAGPESLVTPVETVDVSTYTVHQLRELKKSNRLDVLRDVRHAAVSVVLEDQARALLEEIESEYDLKRSEVRYESCGSRTNGGVRLFHYVMGAGAARVYVTNFDMFTNPSYPKGYFTNRPEELLERDADTFRVKRETMADNFSIHDPSHQYALYKVFRDHDEITYDRTLDDIISAPLGNYIDQLERQYGAVDR